MEKEQAVAERMAAETSAMAEDAQRDLGEGIRFCPYLYSSCNVPKWWTRCSCFGIVRAGYVSVAEEALPALEAAERALLDLNRNDIVEVKALKKPPAGVLLVVETLCAVFDIKPVKVYIYIYI